MSRRVTLACLAMLFAWPAWAQVPLPTLASINLCTDQLALALADPVQIEGLSPFARDAASSSSAAQAAAYPRLSGEAEDILVLRPDVVLASRFDKRATRELLTAKGIFVAAFDLPVTIVDVRAQIVQAGAVMRQPERAATQIARIDAALARLRAAARTRTISVLPLSRRGYVAGAQSLVADVLREAGLADAAASSGKSQTFVDLETIVAMRPDYLLVSDRSDRADDEGRAFLLHPALQKLYPPDRRLVIPDRWLDCGGPALADALDTLAMQIARLP